MLLRAFLAGVLSLCLTTRVRAAESQETIPRYAHVFVIFEENKDYDQI
ncbi:MAG: hypothetical protein JOZ27_01515, partial [Caulobacteraceae bacterium]|nr:hypothetical protein [Caulobacteraceae bacterium]